MIEIELLSSIGKYLFGLRKKAFYPGLPFLAVPTIVLWLIFAQFQGSLFFSPNNKISRIDLRSSMGYNNIAKKSSKTILLIPSGSGKFVLPGKGKRVEEASFSASF